jgi:hypothetical protein
VLASISSEAFLQISDRADRQRVNGRRNSKGVTNIEELRGLDHKVVRNQNWDARIAKDSRTKALFDSP